MFSKLEREKISFLKFPFYWNLWRACDGLIATWKASSNSPRPRIYARHFKSIVPRSGIRALILGASTDAVSVRLAVFPTAAECAAVFKVKSTATDLCSLLGTGLLRLWWQRVLHFALFCVNGCLFQFLLLLSSLSNHWFIEIDSKFITFLCLAGDDSFWCWCCCCAVVCIYVLYHSRSHHSAWLTFMLFHYICLFTHSH